MEKKLYRVMEGKKLAGVCTGLAEYFKLDVSVIRLLWVLAALFAGASIIAYIVCAFVIPEKPDDYITIE
jgi:phage shock protein PspC (stress-responsive transcriptional regulator)